MDGFKRVNLLGCPFDAISFQETIICIEKAILDKRCLHLCPGSVDFVIKARRDPEFAKILWEADCVFADGVPIVWSASLLRDPIKGRVSGTDVVWSCAEISQRLGCGVAMIGGNRELTKRAAMKMEEAFPGAKLHPIPTPFPLTSEANDEILASIRGLNAKIVLVALGAPKQERWIKNSLGASGANVGIGIGSAFDIISGEKPRAPAWMRNNGFEWLYRMLQEPKRLGKRYLFDDSPFLFHLGIEVLKRRINR